MPKSTAYREELGLTLEEALEYAKAYTKETGEETFVFFLRHDPDLGKRYDWTTGLGLFTDELWVQPKRIIWSSEDDT